ncbi:MAG TPA: hypothetical protein VJY85_00890 [Candidatus Limnocylindria bacterium]|jgi:hypothetical protein|nr:hypothetical protein [Candidatus Limnocylindria bacterium]
MPAEPDPPAPDRPPRPPQRPPSDYRPDLRPMLILAGLLLAVIVGWVILSPIILPAP